MKNAGKKQKFPTANTPRPMDEINQEYASLLGKCGQNQYLVYVYSKQLELDNNRLEVVNEEAARRQNLDREAAAAASKAKEATATQETANA